MPCIPFQGDRSHWGVLVRAIRVIPTRSSRWPLYFIEGGVHKYTEKKLKLSSISQGNYYYIALKESWFSM